MKALVQSVAAALTAALAIHGFAAANPATYDWREATGPIGGKAAWAVKTEAQGGSFPQLIVIAHITRAGSTAGSMSRSWQAMTLEVDCKAQMGRPLSFSRFENYAETASGSPQAGWTPFTQLGGITPIARSFCDQTARSAASVRADIVGALRWFDEDKPRSPVPPEGTLTLEYAGPLNATQPLDHWVETKTINRSGQTATAWVLKVWEPGWQPAYARSQFSATPASWSLVEFICDETPATRKTWSVDLNSKLEVAKSRAVKERYAPAFDTTIGSLAKRVCNGRPLLFSEVLQGDLRSALAQRYPGAGMALGLGAVSYRDKPRPQAVDLGPVIKITQQDKNYSYVGSFTRKAPGSQVYAGTLSLQDGTNASGLELTVVGIVDGQLLIRRNNTFDGQMMIPIRNGKPAGKGIYAAFRHDDKFSWSLVEPTLVTPKPQ